MVGGLRTRLRDGARFWNVTEAERRMDYPCDAYAEPDWVTALRGIDVAAPTETTFRWICQIKVAPYSYDWIDHRGKQSPRTLTPGAEHLEIGQPMMIGRITAFAVGEHITGVADPAAAQRYGPIAMSYLTRPLPDGRPGSRLLACIRLGGRTLPQRLIREPLLWGDLIMMRKQLMVLKECAERSARSGGPDGGQRAWA